MVNFARNRCFAAKKPPQTMLFHQKTSKTIDFSWFSLSELPYSKSQQPTCLPRVNSSNYKGNPKSSDDTFLPSR